MSEEQNNTQPAVSQMTAEEFVNKFHKDINYAAETEMNEDKEGDYEHRGIGAYLALKFAAASHPEIKVTDLSEVLNELREGESHPVCEQIYSAPIEEEEEEVVEEAPKPKKKAKKKAKTAKKTKKAKKTKAAKKPKVEEPKEPEQKVKPLEEVTYEEFDKLRAEHGDEAVFEMYEDEIQDYAEWLWREQDRGGPMYELEQCVEHAKESLIDGIWGPYSE